MAFRRSEKPCQTYRLRHSQTQIRNTLLAAVQPETLYEYEPVRRCNKCTLVGHLDQISRRSACGDPVNDAFATPTPRSKSSACGAPRRGNGA